MPPSEQDLREHYSMPDPAYGMYGPELALRDARADDVRTLQRAWLRVEYRLTCARKVELKKLLDAFDLA